MKVDLKYGGVPLSVLYYATKPIWYYQKLTREYQRKVDDMIRMRSIEDWNRNEFDQLRDWFGKSSDILIKKIMVKFGITLHMSDAKAIVDLLKRHIDTSTSPTKEEVAKAFRLEIGDPEIQDIIDFIVSELKHPPRELMWESMDMSDILNKARDYYHKIKEHLSSLSPVPQNKTWDQIKATIQGDYYPPNTIQGQKSLVFGTNKALISAGKPPLYNNDHQWEIVALRLADYLLSRAVK